MKIYLVYKIHQWYPLAGLGDVVGIFTDEVKATKAYEELEHQQHEWKELWMIDAATCTAHLLETT